jgi:hypothetical protein
VSGAGKKYAGGASNRAPIGSLETAYNRPSHISDLNR